MRDEDFKDKVLAFMSKIDEQLKNTINTLECERKCNTTNGRINKFYYVVFGIIATVGFIAKVKGIL